MAYYNKKDIVDYINSSSEKIKLENHQPTTSPQEAIQKLTDEQDLVGFFWLEMRSNGENGVGISMEGKVFVRLDSNTYTDDRFAIDSYQAAKDGCSVTDIIKKREEEKKNASEKVGADVIENLKNFLSNNK
jgi:hypothetical protein